MSTLEELLTDGEKLEQLENRKMPTNEEQLRESIIEGFARRIREKHAILAKLEKKTDASTAVVTSPAKNCRCMKWAKLVNKN